jgi:hypothetical protein
MSDSSFNEVYIYKISDLPLTILHHYLLLLIHNNNNNNALKLMEEGDANFVAL